MTAPKLLKVDRWWVKWFHTSIKICIKQTNAETSAKVCLKQTHETLFSPKINPKHKSHPLSYIPHLLIGIYVYLVEPIPYEGPPKQTNTPSKTEVTKCLFFDNIDLEYFIYSTCGEI